MTTDKTANHIDISLEFDFKGEHYTPTASLDLDEHIRREGGLPQLHQILAKRNNIDLMSYQYEIMLEDEVRVTHAQGLVADFVTDGRLDEAGFLHAWHEQQMSEQLHAVAQQYLGIDDLQAKPELKKALAAAFTLGKKSH
jgi:hypothetical protein